MREYYIGELARDAGVNPKTIRYYEDIGLLPRASRTESGYRLYGKESLERLRFVSKAKSLGLTLKEIRNIVELYDSGMEPCTCARELIQKKIRDCDETIAKLEELKKKLLRTVSAKRKPRHPHASVCPIIEGE